MELHIGLPNGGEDFHPTTASLVEIAVRAEELGFGALWALDHVLVGPTLRERYGRVFEPMVALSYVAARTRTIRLGTSVIVLPMRNPFVLAKQAATLDEMSGGRVVLGLGVGYSEEEFRNVGADFHRRGRRTEEAIRLFRHLFAGGRGPFAGEFYGFDDGAFEPVPAQGERLPIMLGGITDPALRRAARLADMWQSSGIGPERFRERAEFVRRCAEAEGRTVAVGARARLRGSVAEMKEQLAAWEAAGAEHVAVTFPPVDGFVERMGAFADAVM